MTIFIFLVVDTFLVIQGQAHPSISTVHFHLQRENTERSKVEPTSITSVRRALRIDCGVSCSLTDECRFFTFNTETELRQLQSEISTALDTSGSVVTYVLQEVHQWKGRRCKLDTDCTVGQTGCFSGACQCNVGLHYDPKENRCLKAVEQSYAVAVQQSSGGSGAASVTVLHRRQIFVVSATDPEDVRYTVGNITAFIFTLAISATYAAMMILGVVHFNDCLDIRMALYTVVQGALAMLNTAMFAVWIMWRCISYKPIYTTGLTIFLLNLLGCFVGAVWIADSPCKGTSLYSYAVGFSIPMWFLLCLCCCNFWCCGNFDDN